MRIFEYVKMSWDSIKSNKMRSFLTMLGIIIGIASVIIIVSVGSGAENFITGQFEEIGSTIVMLNVDLSEALNDDRLTLEDVRALQGMADYVKVVTPLYQSGGTAAFRDKTKDMQIAGGNEGVELIDNVELVAGRFYTADDTLAGRSVVVIDENTANHFFGNTDVIGMELSFNTRQARMRLTIVGVSKSQGGQFIDFDMPGIAYMPITTYIEATDADKTFSMIYMQATDRDHTEIMGNSAVSFLEGRHNNRGRDVYKASNMLAQMDMITSVLGLIQTFVAAVAAISLVVGGIGVMNIMLVSVTERTREIGIRKALGARTSLILFQFLTESAILTLIGGIIGLVIGFLGSFAISSIAGITPVFTLQAIIFTLVFSASVGIFFGIYPAKQAARLHPIEALRHD